MYDFAMSIDDLNSVCVQGVCPGVSQAIREQIIAVSTSSRVLGIVTFINHYVPFANFAICNGKTGSFQVINGVFSILCSRVATKAQLSNEAAAVGAVKLFVKQSQATTVPPMSYPFTFSDPGAFPNIFNSRSGVFAIVDCVGYSNVEFVVAWGTTRLCWNDSFFNMEICHSGYTDLTSVDGGGTYIDANNNQLDPHWPHKKFTCVQTN